MFIKRIKDEAHFVSRSIDEDAGETEESRAIATKAFFKSREGGKLRKLEKDFRGGKIDLSEVIRRYKKL